MFELHPSYRITITRGDSAELDLRLFNKDSIWHRPLREPFLPEDRKEFPLLDGKGEVLFKEIDVQEIDSEGNPVWDEDSEGNKIPHYIKNQVPAYPHDMPLYDSEGREIIGWFKTPEGLHRWGDWQRPDIRPMNLPNKWPFKYPSAYHNLQEEFIWDEVKIVIEDLEGNVVLEKANDEYVNTIFFDKEDTIDLEPGLYLYKLIWTSDKDTDMEEVQTVIQDAWFEVYK